MPSFNDCIVVPFGLSGLASSGAIAGVLAYADGQYLSAMSAMPVSQHAFFATHSRNGKYVAVLCRVPGSTQSPPNVSFDAYAYRVTVYDTDSWQLVHTIDALPSSSRLPNAVAVSDTGVVALAAYSDGVRVVDAVAQTELALLTFGGGPPATYMSDAHAPVLEFSPDGAYLFVARSSWGIATFSTTNWTRDTNTVLDASFRDPVGPEDTGYMQSPTNGVKFSPAGDAVYFYGPEHGLRGKSWPALTALTLPVLSEEITDLGFSADGQTLYYVEKSDSSGIATLYGLDLSDAAAQPTVVASAASGTFMASANIGLSLSPDGSKAALMGYAPDSEINLAYGGAAQALKLVVVDTATGATQKSQTWTSRGSFGNGISRFAVWLPLAKLQDVTGIIKDEAGAVVQRPVLVQARSEDSLMQPFWTESDATGRFRVPVAAKGHVLSRIAFDTTGTFNDLIDKVQV